MSFQPSLLSAASTAAHLGKRLDKYATTIPRSMYLHPSPFFALFPGFLGQNVAPGVKPAASKCSPTVHALFPRLVGHITAKGVRTLLRNCSKTMG